MIEKNMKVSTVCIHEKIVRHFGYQPKRLFSLLYSSFIHLNREDEQD